MRDIHKFIGVGTLVGLEKRRSSKGTDYLEGKLLCMDSSQKEITFTCFNKEMYQRLLREDYVGEKVKIKGSIKTQGTLLDIKVFRFERSNNKYDKTEFIAIGILEKIVEIENMLNLTLKVETFYQGRFYQYYLEMMSYNKPPFRKVLQLKNKRVLVKGILKGISDNAGIKIICWLGSFSLLQEKLLPKPADRGATNNQTPNLVPNSEAKSEEDANA